MDRLTKRIDGEACFHECTGTCGTCDGSMCFCVQPMVDRLAAYEDTGWTPEEIERILDAYGRGMTLRTENAEHLRLVKDISNDRLIELAQAEKDGRMVVLPCKVGDTVYVPLRDGIHGIRVKGIRISASGKDTVLHLDIGAGKFRWGSDNGRTWFSTRQKAEEAAEKEKEEQK